MIGFLRRHWFLTLLTAVLIVGLGAGPRLAETVSRLPRGWLVALVMFVTALPMSFDQFARAARSGRAVGLALLLNVLVAPPLAWALGRMLPPALAVGLIVASSVPCTLASAAVWTRRGGGNDAVALIVTLLTNLGCFLVLPTWLWLLLSSAIEVDPTSMSQRLLLLVVVPVTLAQLLRLSPSIARAATVRKSLLSYAAQCGVLTMVFFGAVSAGNTLATSGAASIDLLTWLLLLAMVLVLHLILFAAGWFGGQGLRLDASDRLAAGIAGSQKTLMIGLDVALGFGGLAVLPMVAYHVAQLVVDTMLVDAIALDRRQPAPTPSGD